MLRRSSRILLEVIATLVAGAILLAGLAAWRISNGEPIRLRFLGPYIERALSAEDGSFSVRIEDTLLTWAGWERTLDLRAKGVQAIGAEGRVIASVPEIAVSLSVRALLRGQVAPTAIDAFRPRLYVTRDPEGRFRFGRPAPGAGSQEEQPPGEASSIFPELLAEMLAPPDPNRATGYLRTVSIIDGDLIYVDRRLGFTRRAPDADIVIHRTPDGLAGELKLALEQNGGPAHLDADLSYARASDWISLAARFADLAAAGLADLDPDLAVLSKADLRIHGSLTTTIGLDGRVGGAAFNLAAGPGLLALPGRPNELLRVRYLTLQGRLDPGGDRLTVKQAALQFEGPRFTATGTVNGIASHRGGKNGRMEIAGHVTADKVPTEMVHRYWPDGVARGARKWVAENIEGGTVRHAEMDIALRLPDGDPGATVIEKLGGNFEAAGLTVHYLKPMPPLVEVAGTATFNDHEFLAELRQGGAEGLSIERGQVRIGDFREPTPEVVEIEGRVYGSLPDALRLLDHPRLGYPSRIGLSPSDTAGTVAADLSFRFPAIRNLTFDDVEVKVAAEVDRADLRGVLFGRDISQGQFKVAVSSHDMTVAGTALVADIPADLRWIENFSGDRFRSRISLTGTTNADQRAALGLDLYRYLEGPVPTNLVLTRFAGGRSRIEGSFGLTAATMSLSTIGWSKPAGEPGRAELAIELQGERPVMLPKLSVVAGSLSAEGHGAFLSDGTLQSLTLDSLALGETALQSIFIDLSASPIDISIGGGHLDASPLLRRATGTGEGKGDLTSGLAFALRTDRLTEVRFGPDRALSDVTMSLRHDGTNWERALIEGVLPVDHPMTLRYEPEEPGRHRLTVTAEDAGAALELLGILDNVKGGRLRIAATTDDSKPQRPMRGKMEISQFRLVDAPILARVLTVATLTGLVDILTGEGILFTRFTGSFEKTGDALDIPLARAYGPSLGLTATGEVDFAAGRLDLKGTIVPAYVINNILGNIPVLGDILQGGKGEGIFAATYYASGPITDPQIIVNPLAALAPGFLRGLFDIFEGGSGQPVEPPALPEPGSNK